jgi:ABC-type sugar transport system permease subunit
MSQTAVKRNSKPTSPWKPSKKLNNANAVQSLNGRWGYLFTAPFFVMFLIFGLAPIVYSVYIAFFNWDALGTQEFIGIANFNELIG